MFSIVPNLFVLNTENFFKKTKIVNKNFLKYNTNILE